MSWNDASPMKQSWPMRWTSRTSVGLKADLPQFLKIFDASADREFAGVVDGRFSSKRLSLLVVLLDAGFFVIDVQRGHDTPSVMTRVRNRPGVRRMTLRSNTKLT